MAAAYTSDKLGEQFELDLAESELLCLVVHIAQGLLALLHGLLHCLALVRGDEVQLAARTEIAGVYLRGGMNTDTDVKQESTVQ